MPIGKRDKEMIEAALKEARVKLARSGGVGRAKKLTAKQRSKIAKAAARARWTKGTGK
jgi:hypothetical protein